MEISAYRFIYFGAQVICASTNSWHLKVSVISVIESFDCNLLATAAMSEGVESCIYYLRIRGYHVHKEVWSAAVGETLACCRETTNLIDPYAEKN